MKELYYLLLTVTTVVSVLLSGCKDDGREQEPEPEPAPELTDDERFELSISSEQFDEATALVNGYLASLGEMYDEADDATLLDSLDAWLEAKTFVDSAKTLCVACIKTEPAQTPVIVAFTTAAGGSATYLADIANEKPLRLIGWHRTATQPYGELTLHEWTLYYIAGAERTPEIVYPADAEPYSLKFNENGTVNFLFFCNLPRADYIQCEDGRILFYGSLF